MARDMYELLNDTKIDMNEYEHCEVSEFEKRAWKKRLGIQKKKYPRAAVAVLAVAAGVTLFGSGAHRDIYAAVKSMVFGVGSMFEADVQDYVKVVGMSAEDQGYTITLNEAVLDRDEICFSTTITSEEPIEEESVYQWADVDINDERVDSTSLSVASNYERIDAYSFEYLVSFSMKDLIFVEEEMEITYKVQELTVGDKDMSVQGEWEFVFRADSSQLAADTISVPLDETIELPDGQMITFTEYTRNALGEKLYFEVPVDYLAEKNKSYGLRYDIKATGLDENGKEYEFFSGGTFTDWDSELTTGYLKCIAVSEEVSQGENIEVKLFGVKDRFVGGEEQNEAGEEFTTAEYTKKMEKMGAFTVEINE